MGIRLKRQGGLDAKTGKVVTIGYSDVVNGWYKTLYGYVGPAAVASHT